MVALLICSSHVSVKNIKSSLEVVIKSLTKNYLLLRDLTLSRAILMVLLIGFKVVFGLEAIDLRFVRLAVCLSFQLFTLLVVTA